MKNRLYELRKEVKMTQAELASELNVTRRSLQRWEQNEVAIRQENLSSICDFFGVSEAYLLGYSDFRTEDEYVRSQNGIDRYVRTEALIDNLVGRSGIDLIKKNLGFGEGDLSYYADSLNAIADFSGRDEANLLVYYSGLTSEQRQTINSFAKFLFTENLTQ